MEWSLSENTKNLLIALGITVAGFLIGLILETLIFRRLKKIASKTKWRFDDVASEALRGMAIFIGTLIGLRIALPYLPVSQGVTDILTKLILAFALLAVTVVAARFLRGVVSYYAGTAIPATTSIFRSLINILVMVIGLLVICQTLGINITPVITALGIGGLAVALALQDTLANLFAGLHILAVKQINQGDYIRLESGEEGYITDIGWRNTTIRMLQNNLVVIPNTKIASSIVTNFFLPEKEMSVLVQVGVSYASDLEKVERVTIEVAKAVMTDMSGGVTEFDPFIRYHTFDDSSINFSVILRGKEFVDQYLIKHEFIKRLHKRYHEEGIEIPFPIRTVHLMQGES
ncbi:MAG: mechanosensitive ion channel [Candidatus Latescibacteria bacterium]|nr:mechanosensitive ion channel [Candidatus Latescibacterota bacterium]NIM22276.1 mechanosensitive ion channel [Candidatus Latescibacterota bacterium]NIM65755.1 mechanosensitive ion channel [Candidatus Latescibacterota bacterium]NIO02140.1 mechanosensitive ion channel [Candidatus Latescibacterota bacterium]NIO28972.1 mechanosensitive ion channel [Candidatus Latescibacterota bacterium]